MTFKLERIHKVEGNIESITPTCSCGWEGNKEYSYDDYAYTQLRDQENRHLKWHRERDGANT